MKPTFLVLIKVFTFNLLLLLVSNTYAQYYLVYPSSGHKNDCGYCYQLHNTLSRTHASGSYTIETYTIGMVCVCSTHGQCDDPWQANLNDNLYMGVSYYDEDGRTRDDSAADLNIDR